MPFSEPEVSSNCIVECLTKLPPREVLKQLNAEAWVLEDQHRLAIVALIRDLLDLE